VTAPAEKKIVRPYGDTTGDGMVQVSFTLPVPHDKRAEGAAVQLANRMGIDPAMLVHAKQMGDGFTFFVVYGRVNHLVDLSAVQVVERDFPLLSAKEVNAVVKQRLRRKLSVVGACIGTDAHTVGIDAILNMKGYKGDYGLERYHSFETHNLGSQIAPEDLVRFAKENRIDAILASQVVTQKGSDVKNFTELVELLEAEGLRDDVVAICGGPRVTNLMASELGYDAGFGRGTLPSEVAAYPAYTLAPRLKRRENVTGRAGV
jgi:beta-lysine 5,6-aminomutase beta subunit